MSSYLGVGVESAATAAVATSDPFSYYHLWESPAPPTPRRNFPGLASTTAPANMSAFPSYPYQVTVTDEESQNRIELDFRSPTPPSDDDPYNNSNYTSVGGSKYLTSGYSGSSSLGGFTSVSRRPPHHLGRNHDLPANFRDRRTPLPPVLQGHLKKPLVIRRQSPSPPPSTRGERSSDEEDDDDSDEDDDDDRSEYSPRRRRRDRDSDYSSRRDGRSDYSTRERSEYSSVSSRRRRKDGRRRSQSRDKKKDRRRDNDGPIIKKRHRQRGDPYRDDDMKLIVGKARTNIYDTRAQQKQKEEEEEEKRRRKNGGRSKSRSRSRSRSPGIERPSWGFTPSRAASQIEGSYLNGYDSEESEFGLASGRYDLDDDYEDDGDFNRSNGSRKSRKNLFKSGNRRDREPRGKVVNARSKVRGGIDGYRAVKVTLFKNGDPWFGSMEYRFLPGRDVKNLDGLFNKVNEKMAFTNGISYMFDAGDGTRVTSIDQVASGGEYVCSSTRKFVPANYGRIGDAFDLDGGRKSPGPGFINRISYNKKMVGGGSAPTNAAGGKPGSGDGRIIKIVNAEDHSITERVLLNLRTTQTFDDVVADLGQVLKLRKANRLYTKRGKEVKSFSHLKLDFYNEKTFFVSSGPARIVGYVSENDSEDYDEDYSRSPSPNNRSTRGLHRASSEPSVYRGGGGGGGRGRRSRSTSKADGDRDPGSIKVRVRGSTRRVYPPSSGHEENPREPSDKMELDWIYGYKGRKTSGNLFLLSEGELLYYVGAIAVLYNRVNETQKHYAEHTEDITCMALHPSREYAATGQRGRGSGGKGGTSESKAHIRVWSTKTLETKEVLGMSELEHSVCAVAFSALSRGDFVMCVDEGKETTMSIWEWRKKDLVGRTGTDQAEVRGCAFHPFDNNLTITYGRNHLVFWNRKRDGFFERSDVLKVSRTVTCHEFLESGDLVAGDADGMICTYSVSSDGDYYKSKEFEAHKKGGVACLYRFDENTVISGGDRDGKLVSWDAVRDFEKLSEASLPDETGAAVAIAPQKVSSRATSDNSLYVGTSSNDIVEGSIQREFNVLVWGHSGELRGVAPHPDDLAFVTAGSDRVVAKWRKQRVVWMLTLQVGCLSAAFHPSGAAVAVGTDDGHVVVLDADTGAHFVTIKVCGAAIHAVRYSPGDGGSYLAAAAQSGAVYVYKVSKEGKVYKKFGKMAGRGESLQHLDFSAGGEFLQTVSADYDLTYWNVQTSRMERGSGSAFRDEEWPSQTCTVGYAVAGAWNNVNYRNDDSEITSANVGVNRELVLAGDSDGFVRMFRYPCSTAKAEYRETKICSDRVSVVRFLFDDIYVVACAGGDAALVRWKVK